MSGPPRIPVAGPWITDHEIQYVSDAAQNGWYTRAGEYPARFEHSFAQHCGRRFAISLPSCTSGIHLALLAAGVGEGDEVIVPDLTWIASSAPVDYVGAQPKFADVDSASWCISAETVRECMTPRTRAVIAVDLYGCMPDLAALEALCKEAGLFLIEDAAEAIGANAQGRRAGAFGDASVFSFHGSKTLTTGEGGMVLTNNEALHERMSVLRDHGRSPGDVTFRNVEVAHKYKMSALQAALGLAQLERVEELVEKKRLIFAWYEQRLSEVVGLSLNPAPEGTTSAYWMTTVVANPSLGVPKQSLQAALAAHGIDSRPFFDPLSSIPAYEHSADAPRARANNVNAHGLSPYGVNLPSALTLSEADVDYVAGVVRDCFATAAG